MRVPVKLRYVLAVAALAAVGASAALAATFREESSARRPGLTLTVEAPVVLVGRGFVPAERVVVTVYGIGGPFTKKVSADGHGRFTARFARASAACGPLRASALGGKGSRASFRRRTIPPPCGIDPAPGTDLNG